MDFSRLISTDRIQCDPDLKSKKRVLESLSQMLARASNVPATEIFEKLIERERLGATSLGHGVALPHGRVGRGDQIVGAFIKLAEPVNFDSPDGEPVDLFFALLVPEDHTTQHLETLSTIAKFMNSSNIRNTIRNARSAIDIFQLFSSHNLNKQAS